MPNESAEPVPEVTAAITLDVGAGSAGPTPEADPEQDEEELCPIRPC